MPFCLRRKAFILSASRRVFLLKKEFFRKKIKPYIILNDILQENYFRILSKLDKKQVIQ